VESDVVGRALPVIDTVLRRRCRRWAGGREMFDDLRGEVVLRLLSRLSEMGRKGEPAIENFEGYVAGIATRVIDDAIRVCCPEWTRLKHRVRYLVTHDDRFRLSADDGIVSLSHGRGAHVRTAAAEELARTVAEIVIAAGDAVPLDDLVSATAERKGLHEGGMTWRERLPADPAALAESADTLRHLWSEIALLAPRQRAALLLNARDAGGESVLRLLVATELVTARDAAAALETDRRELAAILDQLPLSDGVIAGRLGITTQQVINLRKAARDRLARRLARPR
jgi:DNA-directed RNA polymerase specialized sigma24 family protein